MMLTSGEFETGSPLPYFYSPVLSGFEFGVGKRSPVVRVTDSPYPLYEEMGNCKVDEAAEEFIQRFYNQLKQQRITDA
ncbi:DNA polymerase alpha-associated DNA helicase A [Bienertia sinuspersici]